MEAPVLLRATCPDCGALAGERHTRGCQTVECLATGLPRFGCWPVGDAIGSEHDCGDAVFDGRWPGHDECREFGWHLAWTGQEWRRCNPDEPGSGPDLTRLAEQAIWEPATRRWRQRRAVIYLSRSSGDRSATQQRAAALRRWCMEQGYLIVAEHGGTLHARMAWQAAVDEVADGGADVIAVAGVAALGGTPQQVFSRVRLVEAAGGMVVGPDIQIYSTGIVAGTVAAPTS